MEHLIAVAVGALVGFIVRGLVQKDVEFRDVFPVDSTISFALFDDTGNQLTERALVSIGTTGYNVRPIVAQVQKSGPVHHGVIFMGEYGAVVETSGVHSVEAGDTYVIPIGAWQTDLS